MNNLEIVNFDENIKVKKSEKLVKARYKLNALSMKMLATIIAQIKKDDDFNKEYIFDVNEFQKLRKVKKDKNIKELIKMSLKELQSNPIEIQEEDGFFVCNWISGGKFIKNTNIVKLRIYPELKPYLLNLKEKYLKYDLKNILSLKSSFSIRIYEILKDRFERDSKYHKTPILKISLNDFRRILQIKDSYLYGNIKKQILEKAKSDLEKYTDLTFSYKEIKFGRKVEILEFKINYNIKKLEELETPYELKSLRSFINFLRRNYAGTKRFFYCSKNNNFYGLDNKKFLYCSTNGNIVNYNPDESKKKYEYFYELAKKSYLYYNFLRSGEDFRDLKNLNPEMYEMIIEDFKI